MNWEVSRVPWHDHDFCMRVSRDQRAGTEDAVCIFDRRSEGSIKVPADRKVSRAKPEEREDQREGSKALCDDYRGTNTVISRSSTIVCRKAFNVKAEQSRWTDSQSKSK